MMGGSPLEDPISAFQGLIVLYRDTETVSFSSPLPATQHTYRCRNLSLGSQRKEETELYLSGVKHILSKQFFRYVFRMLLRRSLAGFTALESTIRKVIEND